MVSVAPAPVCRHVGMRAPEAVATARLVLRRPLAADARAIFVRYAGDSAVTRFLGWPTHRSLADTHRFLAFCDAEWAHRGVGPYLLLSRHDGRLLGSAALGLESPRQAAAGYLLARDAWGQGYATESLDAMRGLAAALGVRRLYAVCHPEHHASRRVMEKCGLRREGILRGRAHFPNLLPGIASDVVCYATSFDTAS